MPTYEYKCNKCGHIFEEVHGFDDNVESCPECGGEVRRVFHPVGIIFKGSGFYSTDSRRSSGDGGRKSAPGRLEEEHEKRKDKEKDKKTDKDTDGKDKTAKESGNKAST
ncbi:MAG: FmdB family zinc ribbon protein [Actinomycetota bacterium]|nr:FmdB family zinc ribbon protein [Actinomycetota bacterium]